MAATIKDIAKLTGVSHSAVSYVLNGKGRVSEDTRKKILETAQEIGYVPNRNARNLAKKVYGKIGLFIPGLEYLKTSFFFNNLVSGVLSVVEQTGNDLFLGLTKDDYQNFLTGSFDVDGAIFLHPVNDDDYYKLLFSKKVPFVMVGRPEVAYENTVTYIDVDNLAISYNATKMMLEQKHRKILLIVGDGKLTISYDQLNGYQMALDEYGIRFDDSLVIHTDYVLRDKVDGLKEVLKENPDTTAIVASSDTQAISVMNELSHMGLSVPEDISVICLSGSNITNFYNPAITGMINPSFELGRQTALKVCDLISRKTLRPSSLIVDYTLYEGSSIAAPRETLLSFKD